MKKTLIVLVCIIMAFTMSACDLFASSTGKKAVEEGKLAVAAGKYNEAAGFFDLAKSEGIKNDEVNELAKAVKSLISAQEFYNKADYNNALKTLDTIIINDSIAALRKDVDKLRRDIQDGINSNNSIDEGISYAERLFASGDYGNTDLKIKEIENSTGLSDSQRNRLALLKQQLETANGKVASASQAATPRVVYVSESEKQAAKNAVTNFVYAYEAFVRSGSRSSDAYYSHMASYSPTWSNAYKQQWNYFNKHNITNYSIDWLTFDSVTYDGKAYYVVDNETIGETKNGVFTTSSTKWKYTVINDGGAFKVTNYTKAK